MLEHIILAIVLIIISVSFLGIRVVKARFMYVDLKDPETLLPDKPFRSHLIMEGIIYIVIAFIVRPSLDALWAWKSLIFVFFLFVGCWALIHGILIVRLCKRREMEEGQSET